MEVLKKKTEPKEKGKTLNTIAFILLFLCIACTAFFVYLKNQGVDLKAVNVIDTVKTTILNRDNKDEMKTLSTFKCDTREHPVFAAYSGYIVECNGENLMWLDKNGKNQFIRHVAVSKPVLKPSGKYLLLYDSGGRDVFVIKGKSIGWSKKLEGNIINCSMNEDGYVSIVRDMTGYKGAVEVYDPDGVQVFILARSERFVMSADVMPSGDNVLINTIDTAGINTDTNIEFTDMRGNMSASITKADSIFPSIMCYNNGSLLATGTSVLVYFDNSRQEEWKKEYGKVYSADSSGKYAVVAVDGKEKSGVFKKDTTDILVVNSKGHISNVYSLDEKVVKIEAYNDIIAVNTGREAIFINSSGTLKGKYTSKADILEISFLTSQEAVVVSRNSVSVVSLD